MQIKTITTAAGVNEIDFDNSQSTAHFYWFKNLSDSTLYVSAMPAPVAGEDNVAELSAKGAASVETDEGKVYVLGAGKVEIHRTNSKFCPFELPSTGSGGGGGSITVDSELSVTSTNPLQNRVTTAAINEIKSDIKTLKSISNPNLLINPDFKINQRNFEGIQYPGPGKKYTVDRWCVLAGQGMIVNDDNTITIFGGCVQFLENDVGDNVTASVGVVSGSATANYDPETKMFSITTDGESAVINWAKLEIGSAATAFIPPDPATELMKCYRYFYRVGRGIANPNHTSNFNRICYQNISNKIAGTTLQFPVEMRVTPTASVIDTPWCFRLFTNNGVNAVVAGADNVNFNLQKFGYEIVITNDYFANAVDGFIAPLFATGYTDFDAEIY